MGFADDKTRLCSFSYHQGKTLVAYIDRIARSRCQVVKVLRELVCSMEPTRIFPQHTEPTKIILNSLISFAVASFLELPWHHGLKCSLRTATSLGSKHKATGSEGS